MPLAGIHHLHLHAVPGTLEPETLERHKLDRLRELRATIDALRQEKTSQDPLLAWVMAQSERDPTHSD